MSGGAEESTLPRRLLPSIVVAFLFFAPQFAALEAPRNRYFLFWGRADTLSLCAAVLLLAAAGLAIGGLIDRRGGPRLRAVKEQAFALLFLAAMAVNLPRLARAPFLLDALRPHRDAAIVVLEVVLALMAVAWLWLLGFRRRLLPRAARAACLILSPLVPIVVVQALLAPGYAAPPGAAPDGTASGAAAATRPGPAAGAAGGTPIVLIVFDEWSFERSTAGDDFLPGQPALRALRAGSFFFARAAAPATTTYVSVPRILFQTGEYRSLPGVIYSWRDFPGSLKPREEFITPAAAPGGGPESLFVEPRRAGYATWALGFYLPYRLILGDQVDVARSWSDYPRGDGFLSRLGHNVAQAPQYWRLPGVSLLWKRAYAGVFSRHWLRLNDTMLSEFEAAVRSASRRSLIFFHYPVPHAPFIYGADGSYRGPFPVRSRMAEDIDVDVMAGTPEDYQRSLGHLDVVVGRIVAALRAAGWYDDALIVLTSDHAWRNDPALTYSPDNPRVAHVPLLIKTPRQRSPATVEDPVALNRIAPLLNAAARGGLDEAAAARLIAAIADPDGR